MYIYIICIYIYIYIHICEYIHIHKRMYLYVYTYMHLYTSTKVYHIQIQHVVCTCVHVHTCIISRHIYIYIPALILISRLPISARSSYPSAWSLVALPEHVLFESRWLVSGAGDLSVHQHGTRNLFSFFFSQADRFSLPLFGGLN